MLLVASWKFASFLLNQFFFFILDRYGLSAPEKLPMLGAVVCFVLGGILLLVVLVYFVWRKRGTIASKDISWIKTIVTPNIWFLKKNSRIKQIFFDRGYVQWLAKFDMLKVFVREWKEFREPTWNIKTNLNRIAALDA